MEKAYDYIVADYAGNRVKVNGEEYKVGACCVDLLNCLNGLEEKKELQALSERILGASPLFYSDILPQEHLDSLGTDMQCYLDTADQEWYDMSKDEARIIKECESELETRIRQDNAPKAAADFLAQMQEIREVWNSMLMTDEGRERIIQTYVERIDVYDPLPDDPGHCTIDVIVRINPNGASSEEVRSEIKCSVRNFQESGHRVVASSILLAAIKNRRCAHSAAPPFPQKVSLGFPVRL